MTKGLEVQNNSFGLIRMYLYSSTSVYSRLNWQSVQFKMCFFLWQNQNLLLWEKKLFSLSLEFSEFSLNWNENRGKVDGIDLFGRATQIEGSHLIWVERLSSSKSNWIWNKKYCRKSAAKWLLDLVRILNYLGFEVFNIAMSPPCTSKPKRKYLVLILTLSSEYGKPLWMEAPKPLNNPHNFLSPLV